MKWRLCSCGLACKSVSGVDDFHSPRGTSLPSKWLALFQPKSHRGQTVTCYPARTTPQLSASERSYLGWSPSPVRGKLEARAAEGPRRGQAPLSIFAVIDLVAYGAHSRRKWGGVGGGATGEDPWRLSKSNCAAGGTERAGPHLERAGLQPASSRHREIPRRRRRGEVAPVVEDPW